jgi:hypothetical protein
MKTASSEPPVVPSHVAETVEAIARLHARSEREVPRQQRHVETFTAHLGQRRAADRHAQLDLHINLLSEQKVTKLISLLEELRRDMPDVENRVDSLAEAMTCAVDPQAVASALEDTVIERPTIG